MKNQLTLALLLVTAVIYSQKLRVSDGDVKNLAGITEYNLEFDYSNLEIPKYDSEEAFLEDKMQLREEKDPGTGAGEKFKNSWFSDREEFYEPKFIESFNKRFKKGEITVAKDNTNAKYTMLVHSTMIYAGYNVGIVRQNAKIDAVVKVYETAAPENVLLEGKYENVQGSGAMGYDFNSGYRISEAYAKLAKEFAAIIKKKAK